MTDAIGVPSDELGPADVQIREAEKGIGIVIQTSEAAGLIAGVQIAPVALWPDDRGHFLEVLRVGSGLPALFSPATTQVSATLTYSGVVKAFHYHLRQYDCWSVVCGMLQIALIDLRKHSPTVGRRNTLYVGELRPWQVLIPPGVAHGYKVISTRPAVLVYVTSRYYDPLDECRIPFDDRRLKYDWETQFK
ncbi:MAG: dTDP-4-dehydrorhamnose 3,5-epimerase family protein [Acidobacteria bacterium]|nr:dTDP-4-dehydrorhamnose 3,5-epimerase family protein [Acidobacteriota bacterium]